MKKNNPNFESLLKGAEKLFKKGSFLPAKREFEKARDISGRDDIAEKIKACKRELEKLKAKELIKRGRKQAKKRDLQKALVSFEEAYQITGEDWIREKIDSFRCEISGRNILKAARDAETDKDYLKAARLFEEAWSSQKEEGALTQKAYCLVKAEKYGEAIAVFRDIPLSGSSSLYNYGFSLAKTGKYYECLKIWDSIDSRERTFSEQKEDIQNRLMTDLFNRFENVGDFESIHKEGKYLLNSTSRGNLNNLVEYCKYAWMEKLWKEEQYETMSELLPPLSPEMDANLLELHAKTGFQLAESQKGRLSDLTLFWLNALYNNRISESFSPVKEERDQIRKELIRRAEGVISNAVDSEQEITADELVSWNIEKKMIEDLHSIVGDHVDLAHLVCTPRFAARCGVSADILGLVRNNKDFFSGQDHYLTTGSYYSPAGNSLFLIESGKYEEAMTNLPKLDRDEFLDYGIRKVNFLYGLHCLEKGIGRPERYFESTADLFEQSPRYERELTDRAMDLHRPDELRRFEKVLSNLNGKRQSSGLKNALSLVISKRAISECNRQEVNLKSLDISLRKALSLNPENEIALAVLEDLEPDLEIKEMAKAFSRNKFNKACRIAEETEYREVRDWFFDDIEHQLKWIEETVLDNDKQFFLLNDLYKWCARVDRSHPHLAKINNLIRRIK